MFQNYVQYIVLKKNNQFIQNLILISKLKINQQSIKVMGSRQNRLKEKYMFVETVKTKAPCHSKCGTSKIPNCSKAISNEQRYNFAAFHLYWWHRHMNENFSSEMFNNTKPTNINFVSFVCPPFLVVDIVKLENVVQWFVHLLYFHQVPQSITPYH